MPYKILKYMQIVGVFSSLNLRLPKVNLKLMQMMEIISVNLYDGLGLSCLVGEHLLPNAIIWNSFSLVATFICFLAWCLNNMLGSLPAMKKREWRQVGVFTFFGLVVLVWFNLFTSFCNSSLLYFKCVLHPNGESTNYRFRAEACTGRQYEVAAIPMGICAAINVAFPISLMIFMGKCTKGQALPAQICRRYTSVRNIL